VDRFTQFKLALALAAAILFAGSIRTGLDWPRYVAIALLIVAVLLRFLQPRRPRG
jgi:hypothetical protein